MNNYNSIVYNDVINGEGMRISLFVQGCTHHCKGCFNKELWDFTGGHTFTDSTVDRIIDVLKLFRSGYDGISLLGGEPLDNLTACNKLVDRFRQEFNHTMTIWVWSGYTIEQIFKDTDKLNLLSKCDVLVDGEFNEDYYQHDLAYRGSTNQRIIDIQNSIISNRPILYKIK